VIHTSLRASTSVTVAIVGDTDGGSTNKRPGTDRRRGEKASRLAGHARSGLRVLRAGSLTRAAVALAICLATSWLTASAQTTTFLQTTPGETFVAYPGGYSANQNIAFINVGPTNNVTQGAVTLTGTNASAFLINNNFCFGGSTAPGAGCNIQVQFAAGALTAGSYTATLSIAYTDGASNLSKSITLNGTVMPLPTLAGNPQLAFVPAVTTVAGTGVGGVVTSGTPAISANLRNPQDVQPDALGNLYIADTSDNVVRVIYASGTIPGVSSPVVGDIYTVAGTGTFGFAGDNGLATAATLAGPAGLALDASGNLYIADTGDYRVREVNITTGIITTVAGDGTIGFAGDGGLATAAALGEPYGIAFDSKGNLYIADYHEFVVRVVYASGTLPNISSPLAGHIYSYAGIGGGSNTAGSGGFSGDGGPATSAHIWFPYYLAVDASNNLYIGDFDNDRVREVNFTTGIISTVAGVGASGGGTATSEGFSPLVASMLPTGVATDTSGNLYISDFGGELYEANTAGIIDWYPSVATSVFNIPAGIRFDASNDLYVSDQYNNRIRKVAPQGVLAFASQNVGTTSSSQFLTVQNNGSGPLTFNATPYTVAGNFAVGGTGTCSFTTLAVGASCTVAVNFSPLGPGALTGTISFATNSPNSPLVGQLSGTGVGAAAPAVSFNPTPVGFGNQTINTTSSPSQVVVLSNIGTADLTGIAVSITGANANAFGESSACGTTLAAGASCNVNITFTPLGTGANTASLSVTDNATGSPQTVPLTGTGTGPSMTSVVAPSPLVFDPASVGVPYGPAQTLTAMFQVNGFPAGFTPTAALHYGLSYSAGAVSCTGSTGALTCSVPVKFQPQYPGGRREALFLMNGTTRLSSVLIYGIGQSPLGLVQPGIITTQTINGGYYNYSSIVDENGTVYLLSANGSVINAVTKAGVVTALPITGLNSPRGIGIDGAGVLYIADQTSHGPTITYDTVQGIQGSLAFPSAAFNVQGIAVGNTGNVYETDGADIFTVPVSGTGMAATVPINPGITQAYNLASDSNDDIFIGGYSVNELTSGGTQTQINGNSVSGGLGIDAAGTVYAANLGNNGGVFELPSSGYSSYEAILDPQASEGISVGPDGVIYSGASHNLDKVDRSQGVIAFGQVSGLVTQNASLYNGGNQPLTITSFATVGTGYSVAAASTNPCTLGAALVPGALCQVTISFSASHPGFFPGTLTFTDDSLNSSTSVQNVALSADENGLYVVASPTSLSFGNVPIGTTSAAQTITLTNSGEGYSATIAPVTGSGPFTFAPGTCTSPLAPATSTTPGGSCQLSVTFTPTTTTPYSSNPIGIVATSSGIPNFVVNVTVSGTGTTGTGPSATLAPTSLGFPSTTVGVAATSLPITLSNPGTAALAISSIAVTNTGGFGQTNNCGGSVAAGGSCTITVSFTPSATGALGATLTVTDNATGSPQTLAITGTGAAALTPQATLNPTNFTFLSTTVGTSSGGITFTLSNPGTASLTGIAVSLAGANPTNFAQTNTCGTSLASGASCVITATFTPLVTGPLAATVSVADNATGSPQTIALAGTGVAVLVPQATLAPSSLAFPSTTVGVAATSLPITLSNPGTAPLAISNITVTGANASSFGQTNSCSASLAAGASCTITVSFTPSSTGALAAAISVVDNASGSPQSIAITGTGAGVGGATFTVASSTPSASVQPGGLAQFNLVIAPVGGSYTNVVTLSATGLPAGAQASFLPPSVTPGSAGAPSVLSIQTASGIAHLATPKRPGQSPVPLLALLAGLPLLGFTVRVRRFRKATGRWMLLALAALAILPAIALSGCGGGYFGPASKTYTVTVVGTSGSLQQSTTISLTVQ
jgi:sugar lactone lactonase YvrE